MNEFIITYSVLKYEYYLICIAQYEPSSIFIKIITIIVSISLDMIFINLLRIHLHYSFESKSFNQKFN